MTTATVLFANPSAHSGRAAEWIALARAELRAVGLGDAFRPTQPGGRTVELVRRTIDAEGARRVIYMGGDGTFADVAKGVLLSSHARETVMGMLPMGTANDQGKSFGLRSGPAAIAANVRVVRDARVICIDVGRFQVLDTTGRVFRSDMFFDNASIGFGAAVLATRNRDRNNVASIPLVREVYRDQLVYAGAMLQNALKSYTTSMKFHVEITVDGVVRRYDRLMDVIFNNTVVFGGEWVFDPRAAADDGKFEMMPITGRRDLTTKLISTLRNNPLDDELLRQVGLEHPSPIKGRSFSVKVLRQRGSEAPPVQLDGEEFGTGERFQIDVLEQALPLIVPSRVAEKSAPSWFPPLPDSR